MHVGSRVVELRAFREQRVIQEDVGETVKPLRVLFVRKAGNKRMIHVNFENGLRFRQRLPARLQHTPHLGAQVIVTGHHAGR